MKNEYNVGSIIRKPEGTRYRILYMNETVLTWIEMDTTKLNVESIASDTVRRFVNTKIYTIEKPEEKSLYKNPATLTGVYKTKYDTNIQAIEEFKQTYGPRYDELINRRSPKPELDAIQKKYGFSKPKMQRMIRTYLQSGMDPQSLIDKRTFESKEHSSYEYKKKPGRKTEYGEENAFIVTPEVKEQFNKAIRKMKSNPILSVEKAYVDLLSRYYAHVIETDNGPLVVIDPEDQCPTYRQFYYHYDKLLSAEDKRKRKIGGMENRNSHRNLYSDNLKDVPGPGAVVEVDAMETQLYIVAEKPPKEGEERRVLGRADLYMMVDVYSRCILAMSIGFENNSVVGFTNLLANLADDKKEYAASAGIENFDPDFWPSGILPRAVRVDRGAEMKSNILMEVLQRCGISREIVPGGTGSMKATVERIFGQLQDNQNDLINGRGLIDKRPGSTPRKQACLTLKDLKRMCINFIISHNNQSLETYKRTKKMRDEGVKPIPLELWDYGCKVHGSPAGIPDKKMFLWHLLTEDKGYMDRTGINFRGLNYINYNDPELLKEMNAAQNTHVSFTLRYDRRNMNRIYYMRKGKIYTAPLNPKKTANEGFENIALEDLEVYNKDERAEKKDGKRLNRILSAQERAANKAVVNQAKHRKAKPAKTTEIRKNRKQEQILQRLEDSIGTRIEDLEAQAQKDSVPEETRKAPKPTVPAEIAGQAPNPEVPEDDVDLFDGFFDGLD